MKDKLLIYELDCCNCLFSIDSKLLKKVFKNIIIPKIAFDELKNKLNNNALDNIEKLIKSKFLIFEDFDVSTPQYKMYKELKDGITCQCRGKCESAAIIIAQENNLTILSNHKRDFIKDYQLHQLSMWDMLKNAYENQVIDIDEAEIFWSNMNMISKITKSKSFYDYLMNIQT